MIIPLLFALVAQGTENIAELDIFVDGKIQGQAKYTVHLDGKGQKVSDILMTREFKGKTASIRTQTWYAIDGKPVRTNQEMMSSGKRVQVNVLYSPKSALVVMQANGDRRNRTIELPEGASYAQPNEYWFLRDKPKDGATSQYTTLNIEKLEWEDGSAVYRGRAQLPNGAKGRMVHCVVQKHNDSEIVAYLDDHGLPLMIMGKGILMVRKK